MPLTFLSNPAVLSTGIQGAGLVLRLLFVMALAKMAGPEILGYFGLLTAIELVAIYASGFELHSFSTRRYSRHPSPSQLRICFGIHIWVFRFSALLAALVATGAAWAFDVHLDATGYVFLGLAAASGTVAQEIGRYLIVLGKPIRAMAMSTLRSAGWMPFAAPFIGPEHDSIRNVLLTWAAASVISAAWGLHAVRIALSGNLRMRPRYVAHAMVRSLGYYAVATATVVQANVERFVLQVLLGPTAVGIYSLFLTLANTLTSLIQAGVLNIYLPRILATFGNLSEGRHAVLREAIKKALIVCFVMSGLILVLSVPIVNLTAHGDYLRFWWILPMLLAGQTILLWSQPVHLALFGAHHDRLLLTITFASLVASLAVSAGLITLSGIAGAAFAPVLVSTAVAFARQIAYKRLVTAGRA